MHGRPRRCRMPCAPQPHPTDLRPAHAALAVGAVPRLPAPRSAGTVLARNGGGAGGGRRGQTGQGATGTGRDRCHEASDPAFLCYHPRSHPTPPSPGAHTWPRHPLARASCRSSRPSETLVCRLHAGSTPSDTIQGHTRQGAAGAALPVTAGAVRCPARVTRGHPCLAGALHRGPPCRAASRQRYTRNCLDQECRRGGP